MRCIDGNDLFCSEYSSSSTECTMWMCLPGSSTVVSWFWIGTQKLSGSSYHVKSRVCQGQARGHLLCDGYHSIDNSVILTVKQRACLVFQCRCVASVSCAGFDRRAVFGSSPECVHGGIDFLLCYQNFKLPLQHLILVSYA